MQFFIFTPLLILLFKKNRNAAWGVLAFLVLVNCGITAALVDHYKLKPLDPADAKWNTIVYNKVRLASAFFISSNSLYQPYTRMAPYVIGVGFAFLVQYGILTN